MKKNIVLAVISAALLGGCAVGPGLSKAGWSYSQKNDFLEILSTDRYASLCELAPTYASYQQTKDPKLLNKLLVGYANNLENGCIDLRAFKSAQNARKNKKIKTYYELSKHSVSSGTIMTQLSAGTSIDDILAPYMPTSPQFNRLLTHYHSMRGAGESPQLRKIKLNIERTKLMKSGNWDTYVLINVPEYKFRLFEGGAKTMEFAVITGKKAWETPIFTSTMKYIVLNPAWNVPDNIARDELIPRLVRNPNLLKRKNMVVRKDYNIDSKAVNPKSVNWKKYLTKEYKNKPLPYKLIQKASSRNALGTVKFMFPNRFSVYMHDTQSKSLFSRENRAFSHGCVRLSQPKQLLEHISNNYTNQNYQQILTKSNTKKTKYVNLTQKIPVRIVYLTAYVDEGGALHMTNDVYGYDAIQKLKGAL